MVPKDDRGTRATIDPGMSLEPGVEPVWLRLPDPPATFARRAARFLEQAPGSSMGDYLELLGQLARAQQRASAAARSPAEAPAAPSPRPLDFTALRRDGAWRDILREVLADVRGSRLPPPALEAIDALRDAPAERLESLAEGVLLGSVDPSGLAAGPFVSAALQVQWAALAASLSVNAVERPPDSEPSRDACPVCGAAPVAGVVQGDKVRYLVCSLCSSAWYVPRVRCVVCGGAKDVAYFEVDGGGGAAKAEACDACRAYLKLFYVEANPRAEAYADDVATLPLDLLMADRGYRRAGVNLLLLTAG